MNKIISIVVLVLMLVLAAPAIYAQQTTLEPALSVGYELDDNATLSIFTIEEEEISGYLLDASARFGYRSPKTKFTATARLLDRNYDEEEYDHTDEFFNLRYEYSGQSSRFAFRGSYVNELVRTGERVDTNFDIEDPSEIPVDTSGIVALSDERERVDVVPSYTYDISDVSTMGMDLRYNDVSYDSQFAGLLNDYTNVRANLNFGRSVSARNTVLFGLTSGRYEADGSDAVSGYGINGGLQRLLSEKTTLRMIVGVAKTETFDGDSSVDPVGEITLIRRLETINLLAQYRRVVSGGGTGNLTARDIININFTRDLTERVSAGIGVRAYSTTALREQDGNPFDERDYVQLRAAVAWNLSRTLSFEVSYRYTLLDRVNVGESANSNNITLWFNWRPSGYSSAP
jgi:hypothetical protein